MGNVLITIGVLFIVGGLAYNYGLLGWFGHLPGDIRYESEHTRIYVPLTSMLLLSFLLSVLLNLFNR